MGSRLKEDRLYVYNFERTILNTCRYWLAHVMQRRTNTRQNERIWRELTVIMRVMPNSSMKSMCV